MASYTAQLFDSLRASAASAPRSPPPAAPSAAARGHSHVAPVPTLRAAIHGSAAPVVTPWGGTAGADFDDALPRDVHACHALIKSQRGVAAQLRQRAAALEAQLDEVRTALQPTRRVGLPDGWADGRADGRTRGAPCFHPESESCHLHPCVVPRPGAAEGAGGG